MKMCLGLVFSFILWFAPTVGKADGFGIREYKRKQVEACKGKKVGEFCKFATKKKKRQGFCQKRPNKPKEIYCKRSRKARLMERDRKRKERKAKREARAESMKKEKAKEMKKGDSSGSPAQK